MKLLSLTELNDELENAIQQQIDVRKQLINEMIGNLYPGILVTEIAKLKNIKNKIKDYDYIIQNRPNFV